MAQLFSYLPQSNHVTFYIITTTPEIRIITVDCKLVDQLQVQKMQNHSTIDQSSSPMNFITLSTSGYILYLQLFNQLAIYYIINSNADTM